MRGNTLGFTFDQYKQEIVNGRPVLIQVEGHTMLGYGYDNNGSLVYIHDTWDYSSHTMVWGGSYSGMEQFGGTSSSSQYPQVQLIINVLNIYNCLIINIMLNNKYKNIRRISLHRCFS